MKRQKSFFVTLLALTLALIFSACSKDVSISGSPDETEALLYDSPVTTAMHAGTSKTLTGDCLIYNVFVNDAESKWSAGATASALAMIGGATEFLERRFNEYGTEKELSIRFTNTSDSAFLSFDKAAPTDASGASWLSYAFSQTEHGSPNAFLKDCAKNVSGYDNICFLFLYNKPGRSFATPYDSQYGDCEDFRYERAQIFFSTDRSFDYFCNPAVIAHELLHLFGAIDLYEPYLSAEDASNAAELLPKELMRYEPTDIYEAEISALTAYLVGWTASLPDEYDFLLE